MVPSGYPNITATFDSYSCNSIAMVAFFVRKYTYFEHFCQFQQGKKFAIWVKVGTEASSGFMSISEKFQAHSSNSKDLVPGVG